MLITSPIRATTERIFIFPPDIRMLCRLNDLKASGENSCVTVNSREGERINVFEERSLNDGLVDASLCTMSTRNIRYHAKVP
jgi:hypothetical protein